MKEKVWRISPSLRPRHARDIGAYIARMLRAVARRLRAPNNEIGRETDGSEIDRGRPHRIPERFHLRRRYIASGREAGDGSDQYAGQYGRNREAGPRDGRHD